MGEKTVEDEDDQSHQHENRAQPEKTCTSVLKRPKPSATALLDSTTNFQFCRASRAS